MKNAFWCPNKCGKSLKFYKSFMDGSRIGKRRVLYYCDRCKTFFEKISGGDFK